MKPDPTPIFALDPARIQINDVVLTSQRGLFSAIVRCATRSNFSHAAIVTRQGSLIEAVTGGVVRRSLHGVWRTRPEWICVLRPPPTVELRSAHQFDLAQLAEEGFANPYSLVGAIGSKLRWLRHLRRGGHFCSELVAAAYARCGFSVTNGPADAVSPDQLKSAGRLTDVTASCVRILEQPNEDWRLAIDVSRAEHPEAEARLLKHTYRALRAQLSLKLSISACQSTPAIIGWLMFQDRRSPGIATADTTTASVLEYGGYVRFFTLFSARDVLGAAIVLRPLLDMPAALQGSRDLWVEQLDRASMTLNQRAALVAQFDELFATNKMRTARVLRDMYRSMHCDSQELTRVLHRLVEAST